MKGLIEEYGGFLLAVATAIVIITFVITSCASETGSLHRVFVNFLESTGAETQVVLEEWDIGGGVKATLKDNGTLYITGNGTLPDYDSIDEAPWADQKKNIYTIEVAPTVTTSGTIPIY